MNPITHDQELATANQTMYNTMITPSSLIYEYAPFIETNSTATATTAGPMMNSSQVSLSEASVCSSSMGIRTPDVHPVPDTSLLLSVTQSTRYGDQPMFNGFPQQWTHTEPVLAWPMLNDHVTIKQEPSCQVIYGGENRMQAEAEETASSSMRKSPHYRRNTVSLPLWCDSSNQVKQEESELRRQSMNDMNNVCNLSREQLIQRVVQLEKEKELSRKISAGSSVLLESTSTTRDQSDQDDFHPCRWSGCDTSGTTLDQLIVHIRDVHIGSGKAAYYCQWLGCARNQKPFLKRHKMQNHMRTHTGERPFECQIEDCDKKFSRPDSLNTHIKTHSSIRPYACPVENCGKAYFHSRSLRKHAKSHEPNQPTPLQHPYYRLKVFNNTPSIITNTPNVLPRQQQQQQQQQQVEGRFYADVKVVDDFEQQQQQIFAAGTAYYTTFDYGQPYYDLNSTVLMTDTNFNL